MGMVSFALLAACDGGPAGLGPDGPATPPGNLVRVELTPVVAMAGEPFLLAFTLEDVTEPSLEVELQQLAGGQILVDGVPLLAGARFQVYDDGSHGDAAAADGIFSRGGLTLPVGPHGIEAAFFFSAHFFHGDGEESFGDDVQLTFRSVDTALVGVPPVAAVAPEVAATSHAAFLTHPLAGQLDSVRPLTRAYYEHFPDDRDVLMVLRAGAHATLNSGTAWTVEPWAVGIGLQSFPRDPSWGSPRGLRKVVDLKRAIWARGDDPDGAFCLAIHELTHQWAAFTGHPLSSSDPHWRYSVLDRDASGLGFGGVCRFNDLEMYLAGWLPPDSVTAPLTADGMTIADLIADLGPRYPAEGKRDLTLGLIVVTETPLAPAEMAYFDRVIREFTAPSTPIGGLTWREATNGRSTFDPLLPSPAPASR